eukprot:5902123-Amphidinium_carterae.1
MAQMFIGMSALKLTEFQHARLGLFGTMVSSGFGRFFFGRFAMCWGLGDNVDSIGCESRTCGVSGGDSVALGWVATARRR